MTPTPKIIPTLLSQSSFSHIIHISDIHIRPNERHDEFRHVFHKLYDELTNLKAQNINAITILTGDIFDNKNRFLPEQYDLCNEFFTTLSNIFPLIVILGNHDMKDITRLDSITPSAYQRPNFYYLPKSGAYEFANIVFSVTSLYDIDQPFIKRKHIQTDKTCIALYHGTLSGATNDDNFTFTQTQNSNLKSKSDFVGYDACLLGDIHKAQAITPTIQYSGSLIQQNYGESLRKHGFLLWDITDKTNISTTFHDIRSDYGMITININDGICIDYPLDMPKYTYIRSYIQNTTPSQIETIINNIKTKTTILDYRQIDNNINTVATIENYTSTESRDLILKELQHQPNNESIIKIHTEYMQQIKNNVISNVGHFWYPISLEFKNLFGYAGNHENTINFKKGVSSITGQNATGKTSIMNIILFGLFHKLLYKGSQNIDILNNKESKGYLKLSIQHGLMQYTITKDFTRQKNKTSPVLVITKLKYTSNNTTTTLLSDTAITKIKELVGDLDDFHKCNILNNKDQYNDFFALNNGDKIKYLKEIFQLNYFDELITLNKTKQLSVDTLLTNKKAHQSIINKDNATLTSSNTTNLDEIIKELASLDNIESLIQKKLQQLSKNYDTTQKEITQKESQIIQVNNTYDELEEIVNMLNKKHPDFTLKYNINELKTDMAVKKNQIIKIPHTMRELQNKLLIINNKIKNMNITTPNKSKEELYKIKCQSESKITRLETDINKIQNITNSNSPIFPSSKITHTEDEIINGINKMQKLYKPQSNPNESLNNITQKIKNINTRLSKYKNIKVVTNLNELIKQKTIIEKDIEQLKNKYNELIKKSKSYIVTFDLDIDAITIPDKIIELQTNIKIKDSEPQKTTINMISYKKNLIELETLQSQINNLQQKTLTNKNIDLYITNIDNIVKKNKLTIKEFGEMKNNLLLPIQNTLTDIKNNKTDDYRNELNTLVNNRTDMTNKINDIQTVIKNNEKIDLIIQNNKNIDVHNNNINKRIETYNYYTTINNIEKIKNDLALLDKKLLSITRTYNYNELKIELEKYKNELSCIEHNINLDNQIKELENMINSIRIIDLTNKTVDLNNTKTKLNEITNQYEYLILDDEKNNIDKMIITIKTNDDIINDIAKLQEQISYETDRGTFINCERDMLIICDNSDHESDIHELEYQIKNLKNEIYNKQKEQTIITEKKSELKYKSKKIDTNIKELEKLKIEIEKLELQKQDLSNYGKLIGPKNLQVLIIKNELVKLEETMNNVLSKYTKYKVDISCDDAQNIKIIIKNEDNPLKIHLMSAYENLILLTSFKIAISKHTNKSKSKLYIMDESLENMDQENLIKSLPGLLNLILSEYSFILMVSQRDVKHVGCDEIKVTKIKDISRICQ